MGAKKDKVPLRKQVNLYRNVSKKPLAQALFQPVNDSSTSTNTWEQADVRTGSVATKSGVVELTGNTRRVLEFTIVDDRAIFEGDIDLGSAEELVATMSDVACNEDVQHAAVVQQLSRRWKDGIVPCEFPEHGNPVYSLVQAAVKEFHDHTNARFVLRKPTDDSYVAFESSSYCSSQVGRMGGKQLVRICRTASAGNVIHELCHVLGLWHEQSREDRDDHVRIHWPNILAGYEHNFRQRIADGDDIGPYDFESVMHYPSMAFSGNGQATIVPLQDGVEIGQRSYLSQSDIAAINHLYPKPDSGSPVDTSRGDSEDELLAELTAGETVQVAWGGWSENAVVHWDVIPVNGPAGASSVSWTQGSGRDLSGSVEYWLTIENLTTQSIKVKIRSFVLQVKS